MTTDKERREVARRLREEAKFGWCIWVGSLRDALGVDGEISGQDILNRIADLIEPPLQCPYYDSRKHWCSIHDVPTIGRDALLALADEMTDEKGDIWGWSSRLREAVGA